MINKLRTTFLSKNFLIYCCVGIVTNISGYVVFYLLIRSNKNLYFSIASSYVCTCAIGMVLNAHITFRDRTKAFNNYFRYVAQYATLFIVNVLITKLLVDVLYVNVYISQCLCIFLVAIIGFLSSTLFVFNRRTPTRLKVNQ